MAISETSNNDLASADALWKSADALRENPDLADVLPKTYQILENRTLAELLKVMASIPMDKGGDTVSRALRHSSTAVTEAHYVDSKAQVAAGLGDLRGITLGNQDSHGD